VVWLNGVQRSSHRELLSNALIAVRRGRWLRQKNPVRGESKSVSHVRAKKPHFFASNISLDTMRKENSFLIYLLISLHVFPL
jgi:hypothetical protein